MNHIHQLDESVIKRIAAGEVIHYPANVVKELLENALDAGAKRVVISLENGGYSSISISDDGCGIHEEDMPLACQRHTTSKISQFNDIQSITTFGFRGEALFSMSCVSHLSISSRTEENELGFYGQYINGELVSQLKPTPQTQGTTVTIADLFYNNPAKLRSCPDASNQNRTILQITQRYAIALPEISFIVNCDGKEKLRTNGSATTDDVLQLLFGTKIENAYFHMDLDLGHSTQCQLYLGDPSAKKQIKESAIFVNGRLVQCEHIKKSISQLYSNFLIKGEKPFSFVMLNISPDKVDVNVHPTKKDVYFSNEQSLIDRLCDSILPELKNRSKSRSFTDVEHKRGPKKKHNESESSIFSKEALPVNSMLMSKKESKEFSVQKPKGADDDSDNEYSFFSQTSTDNESNKETHNNEDKSSNINSDADNDSIVNSDDENDSIVEDEQQTKEHINLQIPREESQQSSQNQIKKTNVFFEDIPTSTTVSEDEDNSMNKHEEDPLNEETPMQSSDESNQTSDEELQHISRRVKRNPYMMTMDMFDSQDKNLFTPNSSKKPEVGADSDEVSTDGFTQSLLDGTNKPGSISAINSQTIPMCQKPKLVSHKKYNIFEELKFAPKSMCRNDPSAQTLEQVLASKAAKSTIQQVPRNLCLESAAFLLQEAKDNCYEPLSVLFRSHSFVGFVGFKYALVGADETLYAIQLFQTLRVLFFQMCLMRIGNFGRIHFDNPISIEECCNMEYSDENDDGVNHGQQVSEAMMKHREMLDDLFCIKINDEGFIETMPIICAGYTPTFSLLPLFLSRLNDVQWDYEKECISKLCDELSMLYSPCEEDINSSNAQKVQEMIKLVVMPELKSSTFYPPFELYASLAVIRVRSLHEMYKIFERN